MKANLVAVQAKMVLADYRDEAAFRAKTAALMEAAASQCDFSLPTLVSFPELIGMYLSFVPRYWDLVKDETALTAAGIKIVAENGSRVPKAHTAHRRDIARYLLYVETALEAERMYVDTFASLARERGVYIAGGSIALPPIESEPSKGGRHTAEESRVYNSAYLFSPRGLCINRVPKVYMTPGFEETMFDPGPRAEVLPADTGLGRIGTLVCFDGFHETLVERYDSLGVDILLKPSYNMHPWNAPWPFDESKLEGENWLTTGCPSIIQGRENIRYGVNAMMVGAVFEDTVAEGLSSIAVNTGDPDAGWEQGVLAIAKRPDAEEIIVATVDV